MGRILGRQQVVFLGQGAYNGHGRVHASPAGGRARPILQHVRRTMSGNGMLTGRGGRVAGIEVKATSAPKGPDAQHLAWLRDRLGDRFIGGVVLHTGRARVPLGDRVVALPISDLWASR